MGYLLISLFFHQKSGNEPLPHLWRAPATRPFSGHCSWNPELYDVSSQKNIRQEETSWETMENFTKIDTAGEVTFAGDSQSANQRVERALSGDTG
jgi:hypothetical protein